MDNQERIETRLEAISLQLEKTNIFLERIEQHLSTMLGVMVDDGKAGNITAESLEALQRYHTQGEGDD